ncbi:MAG: hypothetical protein MJ236_04090 [Clostridia bacterium]|nr:hypothetical protein [Clostridia bacterium]
MKLEYENIGMVDGDAIIKELLEWQSELDNSLGEEAIYAALETVIDIVVANILADIVVLMLKMEQEFTLFEPYGLNKYRNFLSAPTCECGCGTKVKLILHNSQELFNFAEKVLEEHGCSESAIFAIDINGNMWVITYFPELDEDEPFSVLKMDESYMDFFAECDAEFRFCCYGLLVERKKCQWEIIE